MRELKIIFKGVMAEKSASKFKRGLVAIKSVRKDKEVKDISQALEKIVVHLTHYHASEGVSLKDIDYCYILQNFDWKCATFWRQKSLRCLLYTAAKPLTMTLRF